MQTLQTFREVADVVIALITPIVAIVISIYGWKKTGQIDMQKTLEHASDALHVVQGIIAEGGDERTAIEAGVAEIERIRGHVTSGTLRRKAAARIKTLLTTQKS